MASMTLTTILSKLQAARILLGISTRPNFQAGRRYGSTDAHEAAKRGLDAAKKGSQQLRNEVESAAENVAEKTKDMAAKVSDIAQDAAGKVKQTAQDAGTTAQDITGKIKDTVVGKAAAAVDTAREEAAKFNPKK